MNKEQIQKHRDVIIWFATGDNADKGVLHRLKGSQWVKTNIPMWSLDFVYVQNDEYAELRKKICNLENELSRLKGQIR